MPPIKALETDLGPELAQFSRRLWSLRIPHRVFDLADGRQIVVVGSEAHALAVREEFRRWRAGDTGAPPPTASRGMPAGLVAALRSAPITAAALLLSVLGTLLVYADDGLRWLHWLTFTDLQRVQGKLLFDSVAATYGRGEYWRLLTPVFLHFGLLHLVFNMLWTWELGRRLEQARGSATFAAVLCLAGAGGNIAQFLFGDSVMFGGMSGVIYGLIGYAWTWARLSGDPGLVLPRGLVGFMIGWLLVCMSGVVEALGFGAIANAAHLAGLVLGAALGLGAALLYSPPRSPAP